MAALVSSRAMAQQPLHSFFTRQPRQPPTGASIEFDSSDGEGHATAARRKKAARCSPDTGPETGEDNEERRKRQRTTSLERRPESRNSQRSGRRDDGAAPALQPRTTHEESEGRLVDDEPWEPEQETTQQPKKRQGTSRTSPRDRMLKLRTDGRLKSPEDTEPLDNEPKPKKRRARTKRGQLATLKYGKTPHDRIALGRRIEQIMTGKMKVEIPQFVQAHVRRESAKEKKVPTQAPTRVEAAQTAPKTTHPFFLGKAKPTNDTHASQSDTSDLAASTSGAPMKMEAIVAANKPTRSAFSSSFGSSFMKPIKVPGSLEAIWPPRGMQHVRGLSDNPASAIDDHMIPHNAERKAKGRKAVVDANDEIYRPQEVLVRTLKQCRGKPEDKTRNESNSVGRPLRHLITGRDLQDRLLHELQGSAPARHGSAASIHAGFRPILADAQLPMRMTAAAQFLYHQVETSLSAFDRFDCDSQDWCHKYAPKRVDHVLQDQANLALLRDWIRNRNVDQVDTGTAHGQAKLSAVKQLAVKRRKRKIKDELDDFIASSDEESNYGSEVTELEGTTALEIILGNTASSSSGSTLKKLKPGNLNSTRAVLLLGSHGCGKTASVYAIAAELGFEVFEINSGTRRNGRDIMEKVGDMTRNHLVGNSGPSRAVPESEDTPDAEVALEEIIDPKQQSVASFFQAKPKPAQEKKIPKPKAASKQAAKAEVPLKPRKQQKQSLILFEEVDVLFEEDKPFWTTVFTLVVQSRRPIIMTCTDEAWLPLTDFVDTACLNFVPQAREDMVDYALCLAANEGHLISRSAASRALTIRQGDLRGALTDLQFWCQMAIGDERAGSGWFMDASKAMLNRTDSEPRLRTVSQHSYPEDDTLFASTENLLDGLDTECRQLSEAYEFIGDDAFDNNDWLVNAGRENASNLREQLKLQDLRSDVLSLADILPHAPRQYELSDCSLPELDEKTRAEYPEGFPLLQIDPMVDPSGVAEDVRLTLLAASRRLTTFSQSPKPLERSDLITAALRPRIPLASQRHHVRQLAESTFEPLAEPPSSTPWSQQPPAGISVLAGPFASIAVDVAPMLRSIARSDMRLEEERNRLSSLLVEPGRQSKRQRTTRAARAALEGGSKASTRRDRYLPKEVDYKAVLRTGGEDWGLLSAEDVAMTRTGSATGTPSAEGSRRSEEGSDDELGL